MVWVRWPMLTESQWESGRVRETVRQWDSDCPLRLYCYKKFQWRWLIWPRWRLQIFAWMCRSASACFSIRPIFYHCARYAHISSFRCSNQWSTVIIKTCKAFERITRQRVVWVAALHRVCLDNTLFLPSFPISDMSDLEIEKAAMGPRMWIELCGTYERLNDPDATLRLCPRSTRIINDSFPTEVDSDSEATQFFIVPGGRYLVSSLPERIISVLDLGYTSSSDCKLIASVELPVKDVTDGELIVRATPDGMGLTIFSSPK